MTSALPERPSTLQSGWLRLKRFLSRASNPGNVSAWKPSWRLWLGWTVPGLISTLQCTILCPYAPSNVPGLFGRTFVGSLLIWYGWGALAPLVWALGRRFPVERPQLWTHLGCHALLVIPVVLAHTALIALCCQWIFDDGSGGRAAFGSTYHEMLAGRLLLELIIYAAILGAGHLWRAEGRLRAREQRLSEVERELACAQLHALRSQLQPHFLFNTLNSVSVLARAGESETAVGMLSNLSELLRRSLTHGGSVTTGGDQVADALVSLHEELEFSERYLHIERVRFGPERLQIRRSIAPETLQARVPGFLLQPLLENAVQHGVTRREGDGGEVELRAWRSGSQLHLEVRDNGPGLPPASASGVTRPHDARGRGHGVGLTNVRERLRRLYRAGEHAFTCENIADGPGACVRLVLPFVTTGAA